MKSQPSDKVWVALFAALVVAHVAILSIHVNRAWVGHHDWNGAVWAQAARNNLRAGLSTTLGVPAGMYFGPLPIPGDGYYVHHPPGLPLAITGMFAIFGEHEWAARLIPIMCSIVSTFLLWGIVCRWAGPRTATLSVFVFLLLPMELYYGRMVNHEPCALTCMLATVWALQNWESSAQRRWLTIALICLFLGLATAWSMYIFAVVLAGYLLVRRQHLAAVVVLAVAAVTLALFLAEIRLVRADAWQDFFQATTRQPEQISSAHRNLEKLQSVTLKIPPVAWALAALGFLSAARRPDLRGLNLAAWGLFLTATLFFAGVRHAVLHDYWGFYFVAPVAIMGGVGLNALLQWRRALGWLTASTLVLLLGYRAVTATATLQRFQYHILDWVTPEPENMIPALGERIAEAFPEDTRVLCNFLPYSQPQLEYYAQRILIPAQFDWLSRLDQANTGGVIWLGAPGAVDLVSHLPENGTREDVAIGAVRFLFWKPAPR